MVSSLISASLGAWLLAASPATEPGGCVSRQPTLGPTDAPLRVVAHIDPLAPGARTAWLELRRLVAEYEGELGVEVRLVASGRARVQDHVRLMVLTAANAGTLPRALAVIDRDGVTRTHTRLQQSSRARELASELGLRPGDLEGVADDACLRAQLDRATDGLHGQLGRFPGSPVFEIDGKLMVGGPSLGRLRPELGRLRALRSRDARSPAANIKPARKGVSANVVRPWPGRGVTLGGPGLPHHILVFARDEQDPNLILALGPVLSFRTSNPGTLSVQLIARGDTQLTDDLRLRLCAARQLDRELSYLRYLSRDRGDRHVLSRVEAQLLAELDARAESCADEPPVRPDPSLAAGPWLDGTPRSRGDLDTLGPTLRLLELARPPLSALVESDTRRQR